MHIMHHFRNRFAKEIQTRNDYLHGTWLIGWASESQQEFSEIGGFKLNPSPKIGSEIKELARSVLELQARIDELEEIQYGFNRLWGCLFLNREVKTNFLILEGKYISPDLAKKRKLSC